MTETRVKVKSHTSDQTYTLSRSDGGTWFCPCKAFSFSSSKPKRCSHVDEQIELEERNAIQEEPRCSSNP